MLFRALGRHALILFFWLPLCAIGKPLIILDPGHGGLDLGTKAKSPYCEEKRVTLSTAFLVRKYLDQLGYRVLLTRQSDVFIPLEKRVDLANRKKQALFVSLHYNSSPNDTAQGVEIFYSGDTVSKRMSQSKRLASAVLGEIVKRTKAKSRGVKKGNFYVIRETKIPAILIEGGFISNHEERTKLKNMVYLEKMAKAIAEGIDRFWKKR